MKYGVYLNGKRSTLLRANYSSKETAEKAARVYDNVVPALQYEVRALDATEANKRRNQLQRERRASPEQKAKEVQANRTSRFRKWCRDNGYKGYTTSREECECSFCTAARRFKQPVGTTFNG